MFVFVRLQLWQGVYVFLFRRRRWLSGLGYRLFVTLRQCAVVGSFVSSVRQFWATHREVYHSLAARRGGAVAQTVSC